MIELNPTPYPSQPLCASCGRHAVEAHGQLCNVEDDDGLWLCASKAAYFANRWFDMRQKSAQAGNRAVMA